MDLNYTDGERAFRDEVNGFMAFGETEWNAVQRHIFNDEMTKASAPRIVPLGLAMMGPVLQKFGSKEQQITICPASSATNLRASGVFKRASQR